MQNKFYITTSIPYLNGKPHIGHALEFVQADVLVRYNRLLGKDAWFLSGTDEHGIKVSRTAQAAGKSEKDFTDELAKEFRSALEKLNISNNDFIRTSDKERHWPGVNKIWLELVAKDDLYKKSYKGLYCAGCEAFLKKSDLVNGRCPIHNLKDLDVVEEENWFFRLSKYKKEIKKKIESDELKIVPETRKKEILNLIDDAEDVSFSRPIQSLKWGIPVPNDGTQTIYVWADALTNYVSALGYAIGDARFNRFWPADVHLIGKDIFRFHAMIWPAMLLSAGLPLPKAIYVHGFITVEDEKMSKSLGNVIDPIGLVNKYGVDVVRYFLLREIPSGEDGDFSYKKLEERYNGDLANGLGNLVQRVATLIGSNMDGELIFKEELIEKEVTEKMKEISENYKKNIAEFKLHEALGNVWEIISFANSYVDSHKPWVLKDKPEEFLKVMTNLVLMITSIGWNVYPFMPETSDKIFEVFGIERRMDVPLNNYRLRIRKGVGLFPRLQ